MLKKSPSSVDAVNLIFHWPGAQKMPPAQTMLSMKYLPLLLAIAWTCKSTLSGQSAQQPKGCGSEPLHLALMDSLTSYQENSTRLENAYRSTMSKFGQANPKSVHVLPVVVHIIHDNGPENISDVQVYWGIADLNDAFGNVGYYDPDTGVDVGIEFCLAQRDTAGQPTNGIVRHLSPATDMSQPGTGSVHALGSWDPGDYINIRLVREACLYGDCANIAGYANFPAAHGQPGEGIVMEAEYFGSSPSSSTTTVHEMGHYLGLWHTFTGGCKNNDCLVDGDRVCDTPPDKVNTNFPCSLTMNSCQTDPDDPSPGNPFRDPSLGGLGDQDDQHRNYMDYNFKFCRDRFTQGQKDRMLFFLEMARSSLFSSKACLPPCASPPDALFTVNGAGFEVGDVATATNLSTNADQFNWYVNGTFISSGTDLIYTFWQEGDYTIRLEAGNGLIECDGEIFETTVTVTCPVKAEFVYAINGDWLVFSDQSTNADSLQWTVKDGADSVLFTSSNPTDSLDITNLEYIQLCLLAGNGLCDDQHCEYIQLAPDGVEICNNQLDDDGDGMVDLFDQDCPCNDGAYQAYCPVNCEFLPDSFPAFGMKIKWVSDVIADLSLIAPQVAVGDVNMDGTVDIISPKVIGDWWVAPPDYDMVTINGTTGQTELEFDYSDETYGNIISIADTDFSGGAEIFSLHFDKIYCHRDDGTLLWESEQLKDYRGTLVNIADFNGDGIPELYVGDEIFNSQTGKLLFSGNMSLGCNYYGGATPCIRKHTIAVDLLPSPGLELAAGNTVYQVEINNTDGTAGNVMTPISAPNPVTDGFTTVGDIDMDGELDVIVVSDRNYPDGGGIWVWDPRNSSIIASAIAGDIGGVPFVGDISGDCSPEIGMTFVNELRMYEYDGTQQLKLLYSLPTTDGTGHTGITMFDFNQDGRQELVYRDETDLRILEGSTGNTLASYPMISGTGMEYPIIADVDNDGEAEILIHGNDNDDFENLRIYCFESAGAPWAPARSVWNQYGYHVTNVNDDLTIPRQPQNQAATLEGHENCLRPTCPTPYNAFLAQATYRTQEGCVQFPAADLSIEILDYGCTPDSLTVCMEVINVGSRPVTETVGIACYPDDPLATSAAPLATTVVNISDTAQVDTVCLSFAIPPSGLDGLYATINDPGSVPTPFSFPSTNIIECNYANNVSVTAFDLAPLSLDLGPDITKCESEVVTFNAGSGFISYLWSDGTLDSIYSSSFEGPHFVSATDQCGNVYSDTVHITIDNTDDIDLGANITACPGEGVNYNLTGDYDFVQWLPAANVSCDSCMDVTVASDTSFSLIVVVGEESCFSADTVEFSIIQKTIVEENREICEGGILDFMGSQLSDAGQYEFPLNGCDSFVLLGLSVNPRDTLAFQREICQGDSLFFNGSWLKDSGSYAETATNINGCDSLVFLDLEVAGTISNLDSLTVCGNDSIEVFGQWVGEEALLEETFISSSGCDSLQSFQVLVNPLPHVPLALEACQGDSILVAGGWLTGEGYYEIIAPSQVGCDTVYEVQLTELLPTSNLDTIVICENDSMEVFGQWVNGEAFLEETFASAVGCDSLQSFQVLVTPLSHVPLSFEICVGDSAQVGGEWLTEAGFYEITAASQTGCDTVYEVQLMETPPVSNLDTIYICENDSVEVFGQWVNGEAFLEETFASTVGCDSTQAIQVLVAPVIQQSLSFNICGGDSVLVSGTWLSGFGSYSVAATSQSGGCDTLYEVAISEASPTIAPVAFSLCEGDSALVGGQWLSSAGLHTVPVISPDVCDTIYEVEITTVFHVVKTDSVSICEGDSIFVFGNYITAPGTYSEVSTGANGCDSTQVFVVETMPLGQISDTLALCEGDSVFLQNQWVETGGLYVDTLDAPPCKTVLSTWVGMENVAQTSETVELCPGDSVLINNQWVKGTGEVSLAFTAANGCDSTHTITVTELEGSSGPNAQVDCENLEAFVSISTNGQWDILWSNGDTSQQTTYQGGGTASVQLSAEPNCEVGFTIALPPIPDTSVLPKQPDHTLQTGQMLDMNLGLDPTEWRVVWSPGSIFSCDTCLATSISPFDDVTVEATFTHSSGCNYGSSFIITLLRQDIYIPNAFSPNGDGVNDIWSVLPPIGVAQFEEAVVFERWGGQVASWKGIPEIAWDGTFRGRPLNPAVFVYYIRYVDGAGRVVEKKGDVVIVK